MRDLSRSDKNELTLHDRLSGSDIVLYYRMPTTSERISLTKGIFLRKGGRSVLNQELAAKKAIKLGLEVLTGFREGDFGHEGKPISSDPSSPLYRKDWKALLEEQASDIIAAFSEVVFNGVKAGEQVMIDIDDTGEEEATAEAGEASPLPKSSGTS